MIVRKPAARPAVFWDTPTRYIVVNLLMIVAWIGIGFLSSRDILQPIGNWFFFLTPAVIWNLVSWPRVTSKKFVWMHLAPYGTIVGVFLITNGIATSEGDYESQAPVSALVAILAYSGIPLMLSWPIATVLLSFPWSTTDASA